MVSLDGVKNMELKYIIIICVVIIMLCGVFYYLYKNKDKLLGGCMKNTVEDNFMKDFNELKDNDENMQEPNGLNNDDSLVLYYSDNCGACKMVKPIWFETKTQLGEELNMLEVNGDDNLEDLHKYNIVEYPTVVAFKNNTFKLYEGNTYDSKSLYNFFVNV
jgi:thiol-disulfide isomerase/thioredoxin